MDPNRFVKLACRNETELNGYGEDLKYEDDVDAEGADKEDEAEGSHEYYFKA